MPPASRFGHLAVRGEDIIHDPAGAGGWHIEDGTMNEPIRLLVVMDPIDHIKYQKDTTLGLLLVAQQRGYALHYAEMSDLTLLDGELASAPGH